MKPEESLYALALGHCSFRTILEHKALEYNIKLNLVKEHYTSKTCGVCGNIKNIKAESEYECKKCKAHLDRDLNGARNILIKHFNLIQ
jgi:putative transposase